MKAYVEYREVASKLATQAEVSHAFASIGCAVSDTEQKACKALVALIYKQLSNIYTNQ